MGMNNPSHHSSEAATGGVPQRYVFLKILLLYQKETTTLVLSSEIREVFNNICFEHLRMAPSDSSS